jgi:hypothetical protein
MPRQFTNSGEKRFVRLGAKGFYTRPKLILATSESKRKRVSIAGKVLKQYSGLIDARAANRQKSMTKTFQKLLKEAGIKSIDTRIVITPIKNGKYQLNAVQSFVPQDHVLSNYIKHCSPTQAIHCFNQMLSYTKKLAEFNAQSNEKIALDIHPRNFALIDNEVLLLDLYPPLVKDTVSTTATDLTEHLRSRVLNITARVVRKKIENKIQKKLDAHFDGKYLNEQLLRIYSKQRPELTKLFRAEIRV